MKESLEKIRALSYLTLPFVIVFLVWSLTPFLMESVEQKGTQGDMYGAVNALFSGMAFAGLLTAIFLQRKELQVQSEGLKLNQVELKAQLEEFKEQNATLDRQRFENTFFQMLTLHNQNVESMGGRDNIKSAARMVCGRISTQLPGEPENESTFDKSLRIYAQFYANNQSAYGHYFRWLYTIIKFIDESKFQDKDKILYTDLIRAQISNQELQLLFYNCLSGLGYKQFKPLIEKYSLFNNLPYGAIHDPENMLSKYAASAYGEEFPKPPV